MANIRYKVGDTWYDVGSMGGSISEITVDSQLSDTSANPVENRVITKALENSKEVSVSSSTPTGDEVLWINPDGTGGGSTSGGGKLYQHNITIMNSGDTERTEFYTYSTKSQELSLSECRTLTHINYIHISNIVNYYTVRDVEIIPQQNGKNRIITTYYITYPFSIRNTGEYDYGEEYTIIDTITEL